MRERDFIDALKVGYDTLPQIEDLLGASHQCVTYWRDKLLEKGMVAEVAGTKRPVRYKLVANYDNHSLTDTGREIVATAIKNLRKHHGVFGELRK